MISRGEEVNRLRERRQLQTRLMIEESDFHISIALKAVREEDLKTKSKISSITTEQYKISIHNHSYNSFNP